MAAGSGRVGEGTGNAEARLAQDTGAAVNDTAERQILTSRVFAELWGLRERPVVVLEGSARSTKTWSILQYLVRRCLEERLTVWCYRHDGTTCESSVIPDFKAVLSDQYQLWSSDRWNGTAKRYAFDNGSTLSFGGSQDIEKLKGRQQDICWLNECMEITYEAWHQISIRTSRQRILDFNPSLAHHWVFERVLRRPEGVGYIHSTFRDNPFLSDGQRAEILKYEPTPANLSAGTADPWKWQVYGLGKRGRREGAIYRLWEVIDDHDWPAKHLCERHGYGLDFGSTHPTALVECELFQDRLYARELIYESGLIGQVSLSQPGIASIEGRMKELDIDRRAKIHADSARPELIRALCLAGWNVVATEKTPDSVMEGITRLQGVRILVTRSSQNLQRELEQYAWKRNRVTGVWLDEPEKENDDAMDALRYWALAELQPRDRRRKDDRPRTAVTRLRKW